MAEHVIKAKNRAMQVG